MQVGTSIKVPMGIDRTTCLPLRNTVYTWTDACREASCRRATAQAGAEEADAAGDCNPRNKASSDMASMGITAGVWQHGQDKVKNFLCPAALAHRLFSAFDNLLVECGPAVLYS